MTEAVQRFCIILQFLDTFERNIRCFDEFQGTPCRSKKSMHNFLVPIRASTWVVELFILHFLMFFLGNAFRFCYR